MSWIDIVFILILAGSVIYSVYRGMVKEIFSLASIAIGYLAAVNYNLPVSVYASKVLNPAISRWVSFVAIFAVVWVIVILIGKLIQKVISVSVTLSVVDRAAGGVIGAAKGVMILSVVILLLSAFSFTKGHILKSFTARYIIAISKTVIGVSPVEFVNEIRSDVNIQKIIPHLMMQRCLMRTEKNWMK
ncbi:MAG: CvpA family protein [Nitrospinae bacterium]|nr:CvpA family protein [Nitrospinota bacterium]